MLAHILMGIYTSSFSEFQDIFDVEHFITSLRGEVRILGELPPRMKRRVEMGMFHSMPPISWSDISYYHNQVSIIFYNWMYVLLIVLTMSPPSFPQYNACKFCPKVKILSLTKYLGKKSTSIIPNQYQ
jgi:hypothetical protein